MNNISGGMGKQSFKHTPNIQIIADDFKSNMKKPDDVTSEILVKTLNDIVKETKGEIINHPKNREQAFSTIKDSLNKLDASKRNDIIDQALKDSAIKEVKEFPKQYIERECLGFCNWYQRLTFRNIRSERW